MSRFGVAATVCFLALTGCDGGIAFSGDGSIRELSGIAPRDVNGAVMVGAHVLVETTGPGPLIVVFDRDGDLAARVDAFGIFELAEGRDHDTVLTQEVTWFSLRTVPDLKEISRTKDEVLRSGAAGFFPTNDGWVHVDINKSLTVVRPNPLRIAGRMTVRTVPWTAAYDARTNSVLVVAQPNSIETVDLARMETTEVARLDVHSVGPSSCVARDTLWLDAGDGSVAGISMATREVVTRFHIETPGTRGRIRLAASGSGDVLAVAATHRIDGKHHAELRVYALADEPQLIASARAAGHVRALAVIDDREAVLVGSTKPFLWRYGARSP